MAAVQDLQRAVEVAKVGTTKTIIERDAPVSEAVEGYQYVPEPQVPGVYWDFVYTGPAPTQFGENPKFAEMVKADSFLPSRTGCLSSTRSSSRPTASALTAARGASPARAAVRATASTGTRRTRTSS